MFTLLRFHPKRTAFVVGVLALLGGLSFAIRRPASSATPSGTTTAGARGVACLGRISPRDGIVRLSPAASSFPGLSPVAAIRVRAGEKVKAGQVLAVLENQTRLETAWRAAAAQAKVAESRLKQVQAGASAADRAAQQAHIEELALLVEGARLAHARSEALKRDAAIADANFENTQLTLDTRRKALEAARARLQSMQEVPEVDILTARSQFEAAQAEAERARVEMEQAIIRAPADGEIVRIGARVGETIGPDGAIEFAQLDPMYVHAEVDDSDARRIRAGQRATVTGACLDAPLSGVVEEIGIKVGRNHLFSTDPASASDARVIEVKVRLDTASPAHRFLQATVSVVFQP